MTGRMRGKISRQRMLEIGAGLGFVAVVIMCLVFYKLQTNATFSNHEIDLLSRGTWQYMPGAKKQESGLKIEHTGLAIRTLEETWTNPSVPEYISNPPQNVYATYLEMSKPGGDVGLKAKLSSIKGEATLFFESKPTYRYDERIYRHTGADIHISENNLTFNYWQEGHTVPTVTRIIPLDKKAPSTEFTLTQTAKELTITTHHQSATFPNVTAFASGEIWFGMDASDSWELTALRAFPLNTNQLRLANTSTFNFGKVNQHGLQAVISKKRPDLVVGTAVDSASFFSDPHYAKLVTENFGGITGEGFAKTQAWQPEQGRYVWNDFDAWIDYAKRHNKQLHGHTLVFGEALPKWLEDKLRSASPAEASSLMKQVIEPIVSRGKGVIKTWDVVNEPFDAENWDQLRNHAWMKAMGPSYIDEAFKLAHAADPKALLGINEWGLETDDERWSAMLHLAKGMKERGVPIHYIGFQMHFDEDTLADNDAMDVILNGDQIEKRFKQLEELGLKVRVSEISVAGANKSLQARVYATALKACEHAPNCIGFTMWGAASNAAYFTSEPDANGLIQMEQFGDDAPWQQNKDGTYSEKPAVEAMKTAW